MAFTDTFSLAILNKLPWKPAEKEKKNLFEAMWGLLREGTLYFLKFEPGQHTEERLRRAQTSLLLYGALAEKVRTAQSASWDIHMCALVITSAAVCCWQMAHHVWS